MQIHSFLPLLSCALAGRCATPCTENDDFSLLNHRLQILQKTRSGCFNRQSNIDQCISLLATKSTCSTVDDFETLGKKRYFWETTYTTVIAPKTAPWSVANSLVEALKTFQLDICRKTMRDKYHL